MSDGQIVLVVMAAIFVCGFLMGWLVGDSRAYKRILKEIDDGRHR